MNPSFQFKRWGSALRLLLIGACLSFAASAQVSINAGGPAAGAFVADAYYKGGTAATGNAVINTAAVANPAPQSVYQTERWGAFTYTITGLKSGTTYTTRLHFAEFYFNAAGQRQFNVSINGTEVLNNFDIVAAAGGAKKAIVKEFTATATGGQVVIAFTKGAFNNPKISGIEISDGTPPPPPPPPGAVRINTGGPAVDPFLIDQYFVGGKTAVTAATIDTSAAAHPAPKSVYQSERWGASTYTVPNLKAGASYLVRLHFAEIYHKAAGLRKFNVNINGQRELSDFDIFAQAGGINKAISWDHYTLANAQGQIVIAFTTGLVNEPKISGIEVVLSDPPSPPAAPSALTATDTSTKTTLSVALSWTASPTTGVSYFVYRSNTSGFTPSASNRISITANGMGGTDTSLAPNTTYYYVVTAANDGGESTPSNEATVTTPQTEGPVFPEFPVNYKGVPFHDSVYKGGAMTIPGRLECEYYDTMDITDAQKKAGAEEGICYHDSDNANSGSGTFNGTGSYLKEFRMFESGDFSYTKFNNPGVLIDDNPYCLVKQVPNSLYLGWIAAGEWVNYTVNVKEAGYYTLTTMYTSKLGGHISFDCNGKDTSGPLEIPTTYVAADPIDWRQAHHWNKISNLGRFYLPAGKQLLTLHFIDKPVFNFDWIDFVRTE